MLPVPVLLGLIVLASVALPAVGSLLCSIALTAQIGLIAVRISASGVKAPPVSEVHATEKLVFSVHVAIHNEPPDMVAATLHSLARQTWPAADYEVIVIDNNTADPDLWLPVRDVCLQLGAEFRFLHRMGVRDAKAGALNIALGETRPDATHVVTVDADYQVLPKFLSTAARELGEVSSDYIQFPQAYAGCERIAAGVDAELEEYFHTNATMADDVEAVLLTGTLSVISKPALEAVGGWSGRTTTEDAEMGVRLCRAGYCGRFVPKIVGRGLLPFSLRDLEKQRNRWASGNLQTLILHVRTILYKHDALGWRQRCAILSQLTAWLNLSLLPACILLLALLSGTTQPALINIASLSVLLTFASIVERLLHRGVRDGKALTVMLAAVTHRIALSPISALATAQVMMGEVRLFAVTDKSGRGRTCRGELPWAALTLFVAAGLAMIPALRSGWVVAAADVVLMLPLPAAIATALTLDLYRLTHANPPGGASA